MGAWSVKIYITLLAGRWHIRTLPLDHDVVLARERREPRSHSHCEHIYGRARQSPNLAAHHLRARCGSRIRLLYRHDSWGVFWCPRHGKRHGVPCRNPRHGCSFYSCCHRWMLDTGIRASIESLMGRTVRYGFYHSLYVLKCRSGHDQAYGIARISSYSKLMSSPYCWSPAFMPGRPRAQAPSVLSPTSSARQSASQFIFLQE